MFSYWEKQYLFTYDFIIVGAGITGLSTACSIKEKNPEASVLILERGLLPTGASTKNAGFACIGSLTEKLADLELMGEEKFLQIIDNRWKGLQLLRKRLGDATIDYQNNGGYELILKDEQADESSLHFMNELLRPVLGKSVFSFQPQLIDEFGFDKSSVKQVVCNSIEGQINTGLMMRALWQYASQLGVKIITGATVQSFHDADNKVEVICSQLHDKLQFNANKLIICTNAFTKKLLPDEEVTPGRGQVLITSPIEQLKFRGIFHFDEGYYYFRNLGNRILFGGGRNLDFEKETTTEFTLNDDIQQKLEYYLRELIIPNTSFEITDRWAGIMAFGKNKLPLLKHVSDNVIVGARLNGMGIALGSRIGEELSGLALQ